MSHGIESFQVMSCTVYAILMTSHSSCLMVCVVEYCHVCPLCMYHLLQVVVYWMRSMFRD